MSIKELKQALEAATPGPWITAADPSHCDSQSEIYRVEDGEFVASTGGKWDTLEANARLIVEAVNNLPKLLRMAEAHEALQARCDKLEAAAREACDQLKSLAYASHKATGRPLSKRPRTKMLQRPEKVRDNLLAVRKALRSVVEGGK